MPSLAGQVVLDLACGTGRYGLIAQERGARGVISIDNSPAMLAGNPLRASRCRRRPKRFRWRATSMDVVLCGLALGHLPRLQPSLDEIARVLKPGGRRWSAMFIRSSLSTARSAPLPRPDGRVYAVEHHAHL